MPTVLITGGTGLIGRALSAMMTERGYKVIVMSRGMGAARTAGAGGEAVSYARWDPSKGTIDAEAVGRADYIIHLAGAGVADKRWSVRRKKEIQESRTGGSSLLVKALQEMPNKVKAVISSSATGWY